MEAALSGGQACRVFATLAALFRAWVILVFAVGGGFIVLGQDKGPAV